MLASSFFDVRHPKEFGTRHTDRSGRRGPMCHFFTRQWDHESSQPWCLGSKTCTCLCDFGRVPLVILTFSLTSALVSVRTLVPSFGGQLSTLCVAECVVECRILFWVSSHCAVACLPFRQFFWNLVGSSRGSSLVGCCPVHARFLSVSRVMASFATCNCLEIVMSSSAAWFTQALTMFNHVDPLHIVCTGVVGLLHPPPPRCVGCLKWCQAATCARFCHDRPQHWCCHSYDSQAHCSRILMHRYPRPPFEQACVSNFIPGQGSDCPQNSQSRAPWPWKPKLCRLLAARDPRSKRESEPEDEPHQQHCNPHARRLDFPHRSPLFLASFQFVESVLSHRTMSTARSALVAPGNQKMHHSNPYARRLLRVRFPAQVASLFGFLSVRRECFEPPHNVYGPLRMAPSGNFSRMPYNCLICRFSKCSLCVLFWCVCVCVCVSRVCVACVRVHVSHVWRLWRVSRGFVRVCVCGRQQRQGDREAKKRERETFWCRGVPVSVFSASNVVRSS